MQVGRPVVRALRAAVFTAVCVLASAALHMLVGGTAIAPGPLALAVAATFAAAYAAGSRPRGRAPLLAMCVAAQYGLHELFDASESARYGLSHLLDASSPSFAGPPAGPSAGAVVHGHGSAGMVVIHLAVALSSSWWLARGDAALAALLRLSTVRLARLWAVLCAWLSVLAPPPAGPARACPLWPPVAGHRALLLAPVLSRRGPPRPAARARPSAR
ncbi:MFS transporter [Nonomuraea sp. NPDC049684]|uniref:MFS transporter n=1 Tax=Nonomuraea sp. NPDC049684 TaxID=3364356 RepID=UPI0037B59D11